MCHFLFIMTFYFIQYGLNEKFNLRFRIFLENFFCSISFSFFFHLLGIKRPNCIELVSINQLSAKTELLIDLLRQNCYKKHYVVEVV